MLIISKKYVAKRVQVFNRAAKFGRHIIKAIKICVTFRCIKSLSLRLLAAFCYRHFPQTQIVHRTLELLFSPWISDYTFYVAFMSRVFPLFNQHPAPFYVSPSHVIINFVDIRRKGQRKCIIFATLPKSCYSTSHIFSIL